MYILGTGVRNKDGGFDVWVDGEILSPKKSQKICNHSPDGFSWGYGGSGPAQLALGLCVRAAETMKIPVLIAVEFYHDLLDEFVSKLPAGGFAVHFDIEDCIKNKVFAKAIKQERG